jgi:homoserine dehydrogenase
VQEINIALLGFGNVGQAFADYINRTGASLEFKIKIRAIADSSGGVLLTDDHSLKRALAHKKTGRSLSEFAPAAVITDAHEFIKSLPSAPVRVLVESLPTNLASGQPALGLLNEALAQGTGVVTVDKGPLAHGFEVLQEAARRAGLRLGLSGTTGVSAPEEIAGERVLEIRGVLNGTTNYILTAMQERGVSFDEALRTAQADGIAEPDPGLDVGGWDTVVKALILAKTLMNADTTLADVSRIGIGPETESLIRAARETSRKVRLVGRARIWQGRVRVSVAPKIVTSDSPFYSVAGTSKAALFRTETGREILSFSRSGRDAISETILDDIIKVTQHEG